GSVRPPVIVGVLPITDRIDQARRGIGVDLPGGLQQTVEQRVRYGVEIDFTRLVDGAGRDAHAVLVPGVHQAVGRPYTGYRPRPHQLEHRARDRAIGERARLRLRHRVSRRLRFVAHRVG